MRSSLRGGALRSSRAGHEHITHKATSIVLTRCSSIIAPRLTTLINCSLAQGAVPDTFKVSRISPLFKSGDPASARNYRPVSLLPIISRILEHFVKHQLTAFLDQHDLMPPTQFAYRKSHSTEDALVLATNRWMMAKSERLHTGIILVDMSKAFDRVQHARLIQVLFDLGIGGPPLLWFCSYLSSRKQYVYSRDQSSQPSPCSRGVPQGSVLGPLLFILYTSSMHSILPSVIHHQEFADDIMFDFSDKDPAVVCTTLSNAVTLLAQCCCCCCCLFSVVHKQARMPHYMRRLQ